MHRTASATENWGPDVIVPRWETLVQWDCLELLQRLSLFCEEECGWLVPSQGVLSMRKQSHRDSQQNPSKNSGPQVWAGLNFHFLHVAPTVMDPAAHLATARSLLPLLTFLITSHPQPPGLQPSVNALLFQHFKPLSPNLYLRTQPCVNQFHPPKKEMRSHQESFSCSASLSPTSLSKYDFLCPHWLPPFTPQPLQGCSSVLSPYFLT